MDLTLPRRSLPRTLLFALLCISGAISAAYFLFVDLTTPGGIVLGKPMAKVAYREFRVRKKPASSYVWSNVQIGENLFKKDSLQVGPGAAAVVQMANGNQLEIGENSLVIFDETEKLALKFFKGNFIVRRKDGDRKISVSEKGSVSTKKLALRLLAPASAEQLYLMGKKIPVSFKWTFLGNAKPKWNSLAIEISKNKKFSKGIRKEVSVSDPKKRSTKKELGEGRYYWRVVGDGKAITETRSFRILRTPQFNPVWPTVFKKVAQLGRGSPVEFRWSLDDKLRKPLLQMANTSDISHVLQVSKDLNFNHIVARQSIIPLSGKIDIVDLKPGNYYWRIKSQYPTQRVLSSVEQLRLRKKKKTNVTLREPSANSAVKLGKVTPFRWELPHPSLKYRWELEPLFAGGKKVGFSTPSNFVEWTLASSGKYQWRVLAYYKKDLVGVSQWQPLIGFDGEPIKLIEPSHNESILYWNDPPKFDLSWKREPRLDTSNMQYEFAIAKDRDFSVEPLLKKTNLSRISSHELGLKSGYYYWKVRLVDKAANPIKESQVSKFRYSVYPPLPAPEGISPTTGTVLNVLKMEGNPRLAWKPVPHAVRYEVTLKRGEKIFYKKKTENSFVEFKDLKPGQYFWTVRALDPLKRTGKPISSQGFQVEYGGQLEAPEDIDWEIK